MERVDYESLYKNYFYDYSDSYDYDSSYKDYTRELRYQNIRNYDPDQKYYSSDWIRFESMLERHKIKILKSRGRMMGWFLGDSNVKDDINYTFHEYLRKRQEIYDNQKRINEKLKLDKEEAQRLELEEIQRQKQAEIDRKNEIERQKQEKIRRQKQAEIQRKKQAELDRQAEINRKKQAEIQRKKEAEIDRQIKFERKKQAEIDRQKQAEIEMRRQAELLRQEEEIEKQHEREQQAFRKKWNECVEKIKKYKVEEFKKAYSQLDYIFRNFNIYNKQIGDLDLFYAEQREKYGSIKETAQKLTNDARDFYNYQKDYYNNLVAKYSTLSVSEQQEVKQLSQRLDDLIKHLKPLVERFDSRIKEIEAENKTLEDKIEELKAKIDVTLSKKNLANRNLKFTLSKIEDFKKEKIEIEKKKNLALAEKKQKKDRGTSRLRAELDKVNSNLARLEQNLNEIRSLKFADLSPLEREKVNRLQELDLISKLNETQIREQNALLKSLEYDKILKEIRAREEERYRQEQLLKEQIKQAEKIYLQEKEIAEKKRAELKIRAKKMKDLTDEKKEEEEDLKSQISHYKSEIEKKQAQLKLKNLEIDFEKKKKAELFCQQFEQKGLDLKIQELNNQKEILSKISQQNNSYLKNLKTEIQLKAKEIENTILLDMKNERLFETKQDINEIIIRKQQVFDLLQDSISTIENQNISELENQNAYLEEEIKLKEKLTKENLSKTEKLNILTEEKEDIILKKEQTKNILEKKIYIAREDAIHDEMKRILILDSVELKNQTFGQKYELKVLEQKKLINEQREDLAKFQLDNFKKELALRKNELDLLKNIYDKKTQIEKTNRDIAVRQTIEDMAKKAEAQEISENVREKLDEILDDVEDEDYDFLADDDIDEKIEDLDDFGLPFKNVVEKAREENKMAEEIEMRDRSRRVEKYQDDYEVGESSFSSEWDSYSPQLFLDKIEDPEMKRRVEAVFDEIDSPEKMKESYKNALNKAIWEDDLEHIYWDGLIIPEEKEKLEYDQKINNINQALAEYEIYLDRSDPKIKKFLDENVENSFSEKRGEINGYKYLNTTIIGRTVARVFYMKNNEPAKYFLQKLETEIGLSARSQIAKESYIGDENVKDVAKEYIGMLREEQINLIENVNSPENMRDAQRDINDIETEIKQIMKNMSFKMRMKIFRKTLSYRFTKLLRLLWKHKKGAFLATASFLIALTGILLSQFGMISIVHNLKKAGNQVKQYADSVQQMGKTIINTVQGIYRVPGTIIGYLFMVIGIVLKITYYITRIAGTSGAGWTFGVLGAVLEILIIFDGNLEKANEKIADVTEETGNFIEEYGKTVEKRIIKNSKRWYFDKPTNEKTPLEIVESGFAKGVILVARGTQKVGKVTTEVGEQIRSTIWYLKIFILAFVIIILIKWIRDFSA